MPPDGRGPPRRAGLRASRFRQSMERAAAGSISNSAVRTIKGDSMGCLNGKELNGSSNGTGALTPIPAATTVDTTAATNDGHGSKPTPPTNPFARAEKYDAK